MSGWEIFLVVMGVMLGLCFLERCYSSCRRVYRIKTGQQPPRHENFQYDGVEEEIMLDLEGMSDLDDDEIDLGGGRAVRDSL